jgi:hypothetical protein
MAEKGLLLTITEIDGAIIYDLLGVRIGWIDRVFIDALSGRIKYALVWFNSLGPGSDALPLPWEVLYYNEPLKRFHSCVTGSQLGNAPRFDEAAARTPEWEQSLRAHYCVKTDY